MFLLSQCSIVLTLILYQSPCDRHSLHVLQGPCEGDSGGPLFVDHQVQGQKRQTVEGIVSGGLSCGKNIPAWYTRVGIWLQSSRRFVKILTLLFS